MSRSSQQRQQQKLQQQQLLAQQQQMAENEAAAAAAEMFDLFCVATTMRQVLGLHRNMCDLVGLRPAPLNEFYPKLKAKIRSWKAQALWKKFDARSAHRVYAKGTAATGVRVLVIGAGPCGLRTAIEAQLLGAKVVVVEKRDRISRNNVLHLWPFVITDLRNLGAKKFYGKFCAGSIDHISIRQLQCILLKVALLLGVEVHEGVSFEDTIEPNGDGCGWRASVAPADHAVSHYEFDVLIGADGKRNTLEGFKRKEFRGKLAIAITANFINKKTEAEAKAEEISGVAFIFNQSFFKELYHTTGIDLENIVYYKDETHYFVMTAKKHSLIDKGVIMQDFADPAELLASANVNTEKLLDYAREAAEFSTKYQMPNLEFAVNHYGKPDVAMFDFTSMFAAETSCRVIVRKGFRLLQCLVGDSLLEPFWPTGSGCARGFLSSMDAAYAIKLWSNPQNSSLGVLAQRESIYRLLNQTTPENLQRDIGSYTVDPATRYPNLNRTSVNVWQVKHLIDTDDNAILEQTFVDNNALERTQVDTPLRRKRRSGDSMPLGTVLLRWICAQLHSHEFTKSLKEVSDVFTHGKVLCALINRYRPDLVDFNAIKNLSRIECNDIAFKVLDKELNIPRIMSGKDAQNINGIESKVWLSYLEQICEMFRGEIPHIKHPKMDFPELREKYCSNSNVQHDFSKLLQKSTKQKGKASVQDIVDPKASTSLQRSVPGVNTEEKLKRQRKHATDANVATTADFAAGSAPAWQGELPRRAKKRRSAEKAANIDRERSDIPSVLPRCAADEQFCDRIKSMEQRIHASRNTYGTDKKPKDLMRAIGKIDSSDWNVREIEKKIEQSKRTEMQGPKGREKVPKWSKEQFAARQHKMSKPLRQDSGEEKFKEIDQTLKNLDKQLKEGSVLEVGERGRNKVASIAGQFVKKDDTSDEKSAPSLAQKSSPKVALAFKKQAASDRCHFCKQTVYLMEKINTEGLTLHRSCLKCHHCHTNLRPGGYAFDRDDPNGRFYCTQHFRLPAKAVRPIARKSGQRKTIPQPQTGSDGANTNIANNGNPIVGIEGDPKTPDKLRGQADNVAQLDLLDRGQTPERIEFENTDAMSDGEPSEEYIIDENEWSGRNFLPESNKDSESDLSSSEEESDSDVFEEANDSPLAVQTLQLATDWIGKQDYSDSEDFDDFYDSSDGILDDGKDDTDEEEFKKARELRREEVRLLPLPANLPTDTETEVQSDSESSSSVKVEQNSATEISTDSEFDHDEVKRETPKIIIDDSHIRKPTKVQVKTSMITPAANSTTAQIKDGSYLLKYQTQHHTLQPKFKPLVQVDPSVLCPNRAPLVNPRQGEYLLNKTASTEGIASKKSLELKKRYLLGEQTNGNRIQKSGSASVLDSKIKSFHSNISECQKLLNPGNDKCSSVKTFLNPAKSVKNSFGDISNSSQPATGNVMNDMKVEITIKKPSSLTSTENEKENIFVNSKNELNKGMEYSETVNATLVESLSRKTPTSPINNQTIIGTIDLVTPEKKMSIIDLTQVEIPTKMLESNVEFIQSLEIVERQSVVSGENCCQLFDTDSNKIIDLTKDSPIKKDKATEGEKPDISKDVKESIPDIIEHIEASDDKLASKIHNLSSPTGDEDYLLSGSYDEEKKDSPEKRAVDDCENNDLQIQVPNIPWNARKPESISSSSSSNCSSNTSSIEDIQHFVLESTTSPDTQTAGGLGGHQVPRVEIHDTAGELMQIDSLMIIDGQYIASPEELKLLEIPVKFDLPEQPVIKTAEIDDEPDIEPVTATPEPTEHTVIEATKQTWQLPEQRCQKVKPVDLKFDTKNENKVETLKNLPLIVERTTDNNWKAVKPLSLNFKSTQKLASTPSTRTMSPGSPILHVIDNDKTPTAELISHASDSETELTGTGQALTETELSDWTADDCISENFIENEFALNTNKGTIKRNKKGGKKNQCTKFNDPALFSKGSKPCKDIAPVAEFEGILRNLDIEEIEFMDTGSEGSCTDPCSATNTAMLRNSGYIEFVDHAQKAISNHKRNDQGVQKNAIASEECKSIMTKRDEVLGIDYIVQGAYIAKGCDNQHDLLKTPVNEQPVSSESAQRIDSSKPTNAPSRSLTDCSTLNEVDDDSFGIMSNSGANFKTTTDESEALTVVTSPLDSSSRRIAEMFMVKQHTLSTPSSSDKNPKSSTISSCSTNSESTSPMNAIASRISVPPEVETESTAKMESASTQFQTPDGILYEDYVRALQQKITQISNARDSLDTRKHRRKSSKDEVLLATFASDTQTVIQQTRVLSGGQSQCELQHQGSPVASMPTECNGVESKVAFQAPFHKVPEIPTLTSRLEEITKERTKQKDIIHDLVMDKLQSKKQLNAEKRLHRSRQRTILVSGGCGYTSGSSISPTPKLAAATTTTDTNCTSQAHYHVSTSAPVFSKERVTKRDNFSYSSSKENKALHKCSTYVSPYISNIGPTPTHTVSSKPRPLSEHLDAEQKDGSQRNKLTKTPSFSYVMSRSVCNLNTQQPSKDNKKELFKTIVRPPIEPIRKNPEFPPNNGDSAILKILTDANDGPHSIDARCAEKMRSEARARARLKSNNELGLSPEEKMLLLRKRLNLEGGSQYNRPDHVNFESNSIRKHKMISSKSTNDLAETLASHFDNKKLGYATNANENVAQSATVVDFTSDPNLLHSYTSAQAEMKPSKNEKASRRQKDPDRRKSIIQSLSNFFHMGSNNGARKDPVSIGAVNSFNPSHPERPCGNCAGTTTNSSTDRVFSRFRLAPKLKEKSKGKDTGSIGVTASNIKSASSSSPTKTHHERSNSQNCISSIRTRNNDLGDNCRIFHGNNGSKQSQLSATGKQSTSSPQLFVNLSSPATPDEQAPPPIPPLPQHYQRSDDESFTTETREQRKQRSISKATRQAELKRLRIAQEIQREQEEIEVQLKELEARGVLIEKTLRGEGHHVGSSWESNVMGVNDENLVKELLEIWRNITQLKKRDEELGIRQQELQLEHRHAQLKEELNLRLSGSKLDKSSADVAAEGAILNEMLEIVAKRASLRPTTSPLASNTESKAIVAPSNTDQDSSTGSALKGSDNINLAKISGQSLDNNESNI